MQINELTPEQSVTIIVHIHGETLFFETKILEVYEKKRLVLAAPVYKDEKVISFRANGLITDILLYPTDDKPQLFKNVTITLMKKADKSLCYQFATIAESKPYNRREHFRCYVGIKSHLQAGSNRLAHDIIIKDVSLQGFAFVCSEEVEFHNNQLVHTVMNDFLEELMEKFSFHLDGIIVRSYTLDDGRTVYGCRLNNRVPGLDAYIMKKERLRLKKSNGGTL